MCISIMTSIYIGWYCTSGNMAKNAGGRPTKMEYIELADTWERERLQPLLMALNHLNGVFTLV